MSLDVETDRMVLVSWSDYLVGVHKEAGHLKLL